MFDNDEKSDITKKLMGWFGGSTPSKVSTVTESKTNESRPQTLLEDLPPKFEDKETVNYDTPTLGQAFKKIELSDFTVERFVTMPCFRDAMLTGFQAMAVLGTVTFLIHKNPNRSFNWGVCGFFMGNVIGWEQCRSIRRKSFQTVEAAKKANAEKNAKKWQHEHEQDDTLKKFEEFNQHNEKE